MWRSSGMYGQALAGLLSVIASTSATLLPTGYDFSSNNGLGGAICDTVFAIFDCNEGGTEDTSGCDSYTTLQSCTDKCDSDPLCRWVMYGLDSSNGEYYRCITFMACPTKYNYEAGEPQLYYKPPAVEEPTYDLIFNDAFCLGGQTLFDCQDNNLTRTYLQCHPAYYTAAGCQAACDERSDCNFMFWGYDTASDYFRCALFDTCNPSTAYETGDPKIYRKRVSGTYREELQDSTCPTEHVLFDCVVAGANDAVNLASCTDYSTQRACEAKCDEEEDCRFYTWGWDERGHWRCTTFTSCEEPTSYDTGSPIVYRRPTNFAVLAEQSFCSSAALFDCAASSDSATTCDKFEVLATCEAICKSEATCAYMAWGKDSSRGWRCATFTECGWMSPYEGGPVTVYSRAGATPAPAPDAFCLSIVTGQGASDGGTLSGSINTGSGLEAATFSDSSVLGGTVFAECFATPVRAFELTNPSNNAWAGTIDYSEDAGASYRRVICETCTVIDSTNKFVVDGNQDETDLAPTQCSNGESCRFVPREQYCVKIETGAGAGGELSAVVYGWSALWTVPGGVLHDADAYVGERCFDQPVVVVYLSNTGTAWTGSVMYSTDYGLNYGSLNCTTCGSEDTTSITVDAAAGQLALTPLVSVGGTDGCMAAVPDESAYELAHVGGRMNRICSAGASFDCNSEELLEGGSCKQYSTVTDCQEICDKDASCQFFSWGWDVPGYNRCMTFPSCTYQEIYHWGSPSIYRKLNYNPADGMSNGARSAVGWSPLAAATLVAFFRTTRL